MQETIKKQSRFKKFITGKKGNLVLSIVLPLLLALIFLILWVSGAINSLFNIDTVILPSPGRIIKIMIDIKDKIFDHLSVTLIVIILGLLIGSILGYLLAIFAAVFPKAGSGGLTVVSAFNSIPIVAVAPIFINLTSEFGDLEVRSTIAKVIVVALACMATMSLSAYRGLTELKPFSEDLMNSYGASKFKTFIKLRLPNSIKYVITALKVSIPLSVISTVVSEYFSERVAGVGRMIRDNILNGQYSTAWAYIVVACLIGLVMYGILMIINGILAKRHKV